MTSLVSPLTRRAKAGVSDADFTALESSVATSFAKPAEAEVDAKNVSQDQQTALTYATLATTYVILQTDAFNATRTSPNDVRNLMSMRFLAQDNQNFITYHDRGSAITAATAGATYCTKAQSDAAVKQPRPLRTQLPSPRPQRPP